MKKSVKKIVEEEQEKPKRARNKAIQEIEDFAKKNWNEEELNSTELQGKLEKFTKQIKKTSADQLSSITSEAIEFITQTKIKRQKLY
jgi:hypothetical protein